MSNSISVITAATTIVILIVLAYFLSHVLSIKEAFMDCSRIVAVPWHAAYAASAAAATLPPSPSPRPLAKQQKPNPPSTEPDVTNMSFLDAHNTLRAYVGSPPLVEKAPLVAFAEKWNVQQCSQGIYDHSPGSSYAESLALGLRTDGEAVKAWFNEIVSLKSACPESVDPVALKKCVQDYARTHFSTPVGEIGHFMNLVSTINKDVGCSAYMCRAPGKKHDGKTYYTCEYGPGYSPENGVPLEGISKVLHS